MKKINSIIAVLITMALAFTSCESRKDVFERNDSGPSFLVSIDGGEFQNRIKVRMANGAENVVNYSLNNVYPTTLSVALDDFTKANFQITINEKDNLIKVKSLRDIKSKSSSKIDGYFATSSSVSIEATDYYGKMRNVVLELISYDYVGMKALISQHNVDPVDPLDMVFYVKAESTATDTKAIAYEYLFDGEIKYNEDGWENDDKASYNANPGQAAKGGYYIISTPVTRVNHEFQTEGEHRLAIRCKAESGIWGKWTQYRVNTKDGSVEEMN